MGRRDSVKVVVHQTRPGFLCQEVHRVEVEVPCYWTAALGLVVHRVVNGDGVAYTGPKAGGWKVTHRASGLSVVGDKKFPTRADAQDFAGRLRGFDWTSLDAQGQGDLKAAAAVVQAALEGR